MSSPPHGQDSTWSLARSAWSVLGIFMLVIGLPGIPDSLVKVRTMIGQVLPGVTDGQLQWALALIGMLIVVAANGPMLIQLVRRRQRPIRGSSVPLPSSAPLQGAPGQGIQITSGDGGDVVNSTGSTGGTGGSLTFQSADGAGAPVVGQLESEQGGPLTPEYLADFYSEHTFARAQQLAGGYVGAWLEVDGVVSQVMNLGTAGSVMFLEGRPSGYGPSRRVMLSLTFHGPWADRANALDLGASVRVRGQVTSVTLGRVALDNCELVDS